MTSTEAVIWLKAHPLQPLTDNLIRAQWNGSLFDVDYGGEEVQISESEFKHRFASCDFQVETFSTR